MKYILFSFLFLGLVSCGNDKPDTKEEFVAEFKTFEDSLMQNSDTQQGLTDQKTGLAYAEKCLEIAHKFPKDEDAPKYMDKAHMILAGLSLHARSAAIADTIIMNYPMYKNRPMVLQSAAATYDMLILPRKKEKVKKYYEMLLKEVPDMPKEEKQQIEFRLRHNDLSFDEFLKLPQEKPAL
jgi:hypothetical protein